MGSAGADAGRGTASNDNQIKLGRFIRPNSTPSYEPFRHMLMASPWPFERLGYATAAAQRSKGAITALASSLSYASWRALYRFSALEVSRAP